MKPLSEFCCINPNCPEHGNRDGKNLRVHQMYGKSDTIRLLECKVCGLKFSERAHTALSGCRLPKDKIISVLHHLAEGCGQRRICRLVGVSRDVVRRLTLIAGDHAKVLHDELVNGVSVNEAQADEKWNFVGKKEGVCLNEEKEEQGDQWDHVVIDSESKAVISMVIGKRTKENTEELISDFSHRVNEGKPPRLFTADDYPCYKDALLSIYGKWVVPEPTGKRGRPRRPYQTIPDMQYATLCSAESGIQE
jgi:transposase-like protein